MLRKITGGFALTLLSIVLTLAVAEIALRFTFYSNLRIPDYSYPANYFVADEEIGYDIAPNTSGKVHYLGDYHYEVSSNRYGCFDYDRDVPADYTLVVGDSMTWGYSPLEHKWATRLEELSGHFHAKCGVTGYGTIQEMKKAQRVIAQIGHTPKRLIVMYIPNDFNDDFFFPQRTVYAGKLVSWVEQLDLDSGEQQRRDYEQIARINAKYEEGTLRNRLRKWYRNLVLYRLLRIGQDYISTVRRSANVEKAKTASSPVVAPQPATHARGKKILPAGMTQSIYRVTLAEYLDTDRPWYNAALEQHKRNLIAFAEYADSIGARLLLVDTYGTMMHPRFNDVRAYYDASGTHHYYNLRADYRVFDTWETDGHWNIEGNQKAAGYIYDFANKVGFFED